MDDINNKTAILTAFSLKGILHIFILQNFLTVSNLQLIFIKVYLNYHDYEI
jgi:hypothetical protein